MPIDSDRRGENCFKLKEGRFRLDVREKFFTEKVMKCWDMLLRELVSAPNRGGV